MDVNENRCRLCSAPTFISFRSRVLGSLDVDYFQCSECESLQTEQPYWLDQAYAAGNLADVDTGPFQRCVEGQAVIYTLARFLRMPSNAKLLEVGGGNGLLCRMLRDIGFDARVSDAYASNTLARGFDDDGRQPDIAFAFEVAEHFPEPRQQLVTILGRNAEACVLSTAVYRNQKADWWYISQETGQHVFFYSEKSMKMIAERFRYFYERIDHWHFFLRRPLPRLAEKIFWRLIERKGLRLVRVWLALRLNDKFALVDRDNALRQVKAAHSTAAITGNLAH